MIQGRVQAIQVAVEGINMTNWGVKFVLPRTEQKYPHVPVMFCDVKTRKERMLAGYGKIYEKIPNTYNWRPV